MTILKKIIFFPVLLIFLKHYYEVLVTGVKSINQCENEGLNKFLFNNVLLINLEHTVNVGYTWHLYRIGL